MGIVGFKLPWAPGVGDLVAAWSAPAIDGEVFHRDSAAGRALLLCVLPWRDGAAAPFLDALAARTDELRELGCEPRCFVPSAAAAGGARDLPVLVDEGLAISRALTLAVERRGDGEPEPRALLVGGDSRVIGAVPLEATAESAEAAVALARDHAPFDRFRPAHAPVLHLPGVFSPDLCAELVAAFRSGASREGMTIGVRDGKTARFAQPDVKVRRDYTLEGPLLERVWQTLRWRAFPLVRQASRFEITRFEYLQVGRYGAEDGGRFGPHRDDTREGAHHRRFAITLALNDDYEGGALVFPAHGATYRPATGEAVIFSCSLLHEARQVTRGERFVLVGMFFGEGEVIQRQRSRVVLGDVPPPALGPEEQRRRQLVAGARLWREIAGDVEALGTHLDTPAALPDHVGERIEMLERALGQLRDDLKRLRGPFVAAQVEALDLGDGPSGLKLHLGCGGHRLPGWINVDAHGGELRMDLRWRLPFPDASVRYALAEHVLEHFYRGSELSEVLREILRVLEPGGVLRIAVPDLEKCLRAYVADDAAFFADRRHTWKWAETCKTRLDHFLGYAGADQTLESFGSHKYGYDFETLSLVLREAGFAAVERSEFMESAHEALRVDDQSANATANSNGVFYSLFVEAKKAGSAG